MSNFEEIIDNNAAKVQRPLSYIVRTILLISITYSLYFSLWRILFINLVLLIILLTPVIIRKYKIEMPVEIEIILLAFVIATFFLGEIRGLIIQIFFGLAMGFVGFSFMLIVSKNSELKINSFLTYVSTLSLSLGLAALLEISKYALKITSGMGISIIDYQYAMQSLIFVLIGSLIANTIALAYLNEYDIPFIGKLIKRFKKKNPKLFIERLDSPEEVLKLIEKGENEKLEFKSTLRTNLHTGEHDKRIEHACLKTISAFLNTNGGTLLIGVTDSKNICGIEKDNFQSKDRFNLHFTNLVKEYIGNDLLPYLHFELIQIEEKNILKVDCQKSNKPVFLKFQKVEEFYIRAGAATVQSFGSKLVNYINNNFN